MALKVGDFYTVKKDKEILYSDAYVADAKNTWSQPIGYLTKGNTHKITLIYYGTGNGSPNQTDGPGKMPIYAINHATGNYNIGWVRDEGGGVTGARVYGLPSSITAESTGFRVTLEGSKGVDFDITAKIGSTTIYSSTGTMGFDKAYWDLSFNATARSRMVSALGSYSSRTMTVTVVSKYNGSTIRTTSAETTVTAPPRAVAKPPVWTKNPTITFTNLKDGKVYQNQTTVNVSFSSSDLSYDSGARYNSSYIKIGDITENNKTSYSLVPNKSGKLDITVGVGDTNGKWVYYTDSVTVEMAAAISIDTFTANRLGDSGVKLTARGSFTSLTETPTGTNLTYSFDRRVRGTSTWVSMMSNIKVTTSGETWSVSISQSSGYDGTKSYDFRLTIKGAISTATGTSVIGTEAVPMSWGKHGSGVGVMFDNANSASLQVGDGGIDSLGPIKVAGKSIGLVNQRNNENLQYWVGTKAQFDAISTKSSTTIYDIIG